MANQRPLDAPHRQHTVRAQRIRRLADHVERILSLHREAIEAIELTLPDGSGRGAGLEPVSGGDTSRPVEGVVLERERVLDSIEDDTELEARRVGLAAVDTSLAVIEHALGEIRTELSRLAARALAGVERQRTNMVDCAACERPVAQTPTDRLRAGYCAACYRAWLRDGRPDRFTFERSRRGTTHDVEVTIHTDEHRPGRTPRVGAVTLTVGAVEVDLPPDLAARYAELGPSPEREDLHALWREALERVGS